MSLSRRATFARLAAAVSAGLVAFKAADAVAAPPSTPSTPAAGVPKVVYHLADADKASFVLSNIDNHFKGMGGTDKVHIALVVHGPALGVFKAGKADADLSRRLADLVARGVDLGACGNTLDAQHLDVADLLPGFTRIGEGGVVRLAQLQAQGYAYLRP